METSKQSNMHQMRQGLQNVEVGRCTEGERKKEEGRKKEVKEEV